MYSHRSGFKPGTDSIASHARRRYRLLPSKTHNSGLPPPDPALWIVHYHKAERRDCIPAQSVPVMPQVQTMLSQRRYLQSHGQLGRKEFMLHDRANWPVINFPAMQSAVPPGRPGHSPMMPGYPAPGPMGGRTGLPAHNRVRSIGMMPGEITVEEEEDVSRGDVLDFMTPRDISKMRYIQHHEWMEEIMSSPYATKQIIPTDLGLGRKGELEALTRGFFEAPTSIHQEHSDNAAPARVGKLDPGKAEDFTNMAAQKVADMQADLEKMKERHAKRMAKLRKTTVLNTAEKRLRTASNGSRENGAEQVLRRGEIVEDIVHEVEETTGRRIGTMTNVKLVQRGGLEYPAPTKPADTRAAANGQPSSQRASTSTLNEPPSNRPTVTPQPATAHLGPPQPLLLSAPASSANGTPAMQSEDSAEPTDLEPDEEADAAGEDDENENEHENIPDLDDMDVDVEMAGLDDQDHDEDQDQDQDQDAAVEAEVEDALQDAAEADAEAGDWVLVNDNVEIDTSTAAALHAQAQEQEAHLPTQPPAPRGDTATQAGVLGEDGIFGDVDVDDPVHIGDPATEDLSAFAEDTELGADLDMEAEAEAGADEAARMRSGTGLRGDMDGDLVDDMDAGMDTDGELELDDVMDDSAFGEAFHAREEEAGDSEFS
jgi:hypothetical protein